MQTNVKLPRKKSTPFGSGVGSTTKAKSPFVGINTEELESETDQAPPRSFKNSYLRPKKAGLRKLAKSPSNKQIQGLVLESTDAANQNDQIQEEHVNSKYKPQPSKTKKSIPKKKAGRPSRTSSARKEPEEARAPEGIQEAGHEDEGDADLLNDRALDLQEKMK